MDEENLEVTDEFILEPNSDPPLRRGKTTARIRLGKRQYILQVKTEIREVKDKPATVITLPPPPARESLKP